MNDEEMFEDEPETEEEMEQRMAAERKQREELERPRSEWERRSLTALKWVVVAKDGALRKLGAGTFDATLPNWSRSLYPVLGDVVFTHASGKKENFYKPILVAGVLEGEVMKSYELFLPRKKNSLSFLASTLMVHDTQRCSSLSIEAIDHGSPPQT